MLRHILLRLIQYMSVVLVHKAAFFVYKHHSYKKYYL